MPRAAPARAPSRPPTGKPGRPSALTPETLILMRGALLALNTIDDSFRVAGIHPSTGYKWLKAGRNARSGEYREFFEQVEDARTQAKAILVGKVAEGARGNPKLALEVLARRWPEEWAKRLKIEDDSTPGAKKKREGVRDRVAGQLDRIEKRMNAQLNIEAVEPLPEREPT